LRNKDLHNKVGGLLDVPSDREKKIISQRLVSTAGNGRLSKKSARNWRHAREDPPIAE
jgi:hypothetical protein